jgi:DNA-binding response OmpR family regulator
VAEKMEASGVSIDVSARDVRVGGRQVELTGLEFDLLVALVRRAGRVIPRDALLGEAGRSDTTVGERTVDVHISHLRQKLGDEGSRLIKTVRGVGYLFSKDGA